MDPVICCELCSPEAFVEFAQVDIPKPKAAQQRSRLKVYSRQSTDMALRDALDEFREDMTIKMEGRAVLQDYGASVFMTDQVLERIVDCAHYGKITTIEQLARETRWAHASEHGTAVLALIAAHVPLATEAASSRPNPFVSTPLRVHGDIVNGVATPTGSSTSAPHIPVASGSGSKAQPRKCSSCGQLGHQCELADHILMIISDTQLR